MRLTANIQEFKTTIVFIHGFRKDSTYWNTSEHGYTLAIESTLAKVANTVLIDLTDEDYMKDITTIADEIYAKIDRHFQKIILVGHSHGCFYCLRLAEKHPIYYNRLLLLDPTLKNPEYHKYLQEKISDNVEEAKLKYFEDLPDGRDLYCTTIIWIHFNVNSETTPSKIEELYKFTNKNSKSRLMAHYNVSHMIHYKIPSVIINSIKELMKV